MIKAMRFEYDIAVRVERENHLVQEDNVMSRSSGITLIWILLCNLTLWSKQRRHVSTARGGDQMAAITGRSKLLSNVTDTEKMLMYSGNNKLGVGSTLDVFT
jgi:hypothetical protein